MATVQSIDDGYNIGTTGSSATNAGQARLVQPNEIDSRGQKRTNTDANYNPLSTAIRRLNPLSEFSSWNYQLTFYMITPACFNYFQETGKLDSSGGWYIIAQSGGINSDREPRAILDDRTKVGVGPGLDYYINDLSIETYMMASDGSKTATANAEINFKIIEPTGFTLVTKLQRTSNIINASSKELLDNIKPEALPSLYQQHFLIGIKFYGYGPDGELYDNSKFSEYNQSLNDKFGLFERIFPLAISEFNFKVDGRSTVYNVKAVVANLHAAYSNKRGIINQNMELEGSTLGEIIGSLDYPNKKSLITQLNNQQWEYKINNKVIKWNQTFQVEWIDGADVKKEKLINSNLVLNDDYIQQTAAMSNALKVEDVNIKQEKQNNIINTSKKISGISPGTNIVRVIDNLITKSTYIRDALAQTVDQNIESESQPESVDILNWYIINPVIKVTARDPLTKDWAYDITYQIRPYTIPYIRNNIVGKKRKYYGPVKLYNYTFTGDNTEIISWEMNYDNLYYVIQNATTTSDRIASSSKTAVPTQVKGGNNSDPTSSMLNNGGLSEDNVRATLYSLGDIAETNFRIMGDPDFLMTAIGSRIQTGTASSFVNKDLSINPYSGQVFIEIVFKVAEDYQNNGLLDVDQGQRVAFYPFDQQNIVKNQGLVFKLNKVTSYFNNGKFEQELQAFMVPLDDLIIEDKKQEEQRREVQDGGAGRGRSPGATLEDAELYWLTQGNIDKNAVDATTYTGNESAFVPTAGTPLSGQAWDDAMQMTESEAQRKLRLKRQADAEAFVNQRREQTVSSGIEGRSISEQIVAP